MPTLSEAEGGLEVGQGRLLQGRQVVSPLSHGSASAMQSVDDLPPASWSIPSGKFVFPTDTPSRVKVMSFQLTFCFRREPRLRSRCPASSSSRDWTATGPNSPFGSKVGSKGAVLASSSRFLVQGTRLRCRETSPVRIGSGPVF